MGYLKDRSVVLVTGATGAIGFEIAAMAAQEGATVAVHGSRSESVAVAMERLLARVPTARLIAAPADYTKPGEIEEMVAHVAREAGRIDAVVACAITGAPGMTGVFAKTIPENYGAIAGAVLGSFQRLCHAAMPHLSVEGGAIVAFAADSGRFASARQSVIGAAYGAIMSFVRNLAMEVSRDGVRVHCISPTFVAETPIYEAFAADPRAAAATARAGLGLPTPADIAPMVLFLCGPAAARTTGQIISINGGLNA